MISERYADSLYLDMIPGGALLRCFVMRRANKCQDGSSALRLQWCGMPQIQVHVENILQSKKEPLTT